jgi:hypothetical protein
MGLKKVMKEFVINMLKCNCSDDKIMIYLEISVEELNDIKASLSTEPPPVLRTTINKIINSLSVEV